MIVTNWNACVFGDQRKLIVMDVTVAMIENAQKPKNKDIFATIFAATVSLEWSEKWRPRQAGANKFPFKIPDA